MSALRDSASRLNFYSCHPPGVTKGFIKGEALRLLRTNSSQFNFEENMSNFKTRLQNRDYPATIVEKHLSEIKSESMGGPGRCATCDLSDFNETWPV